MPEIKLSIIIVSWNVGELLSKCLKSIYLYSLGLEIEVYVVDNASADGSAEMVKNNFPQVKLIASRENLGFAKANNLALKEARGEYVLFLNPDTEIFPDTLNKSLAFMASHRDTGVMGCKMVYRDGSLQPSVRRFPTILAILEMFLKLPKIFSRLRAIDHYLAKGFDYNREQVVDQVMGAYMLIPKLVIEKVGLLDERFFTWFEEVDYCLRVKRASYRVYYNPEVKIIHHGGTSFAQAGMIKNQWRFFHSALKYFLKNVFISRILD